MPHVPEGPLLFDTSAESLICRTPHDHLPAWLQDYLGRRQADISAVTVFERIRGYELLLNRASAENRSQIGKLKAEYLSELGTIWPVDAGAAIVAAAIMALVPNPPSPPRKSHRIAESRQSRLARWQNDILVAATAVAAGLPLVHNNAIDFEAIRAAVESAPERLPGFGPLVLIRCNWLM